MVDDFMPKRMKVERNVDDIRIKHERKIVWEIYKMTRLFMD